jgi:hypothetical protein
VATATKISQLTTAGPLTGAELVPVVQNGGTLQTTVSLLKLFSMGNIENEVSALDARVIAVSTLATQNAVAIASVQTDLGNLTTRVANVSASVSSLNVQMTAAQASISAINSLLAAIDVSAVNTLLPAVSALEIRVSAVSAAVSVNTADIANLSVVVANVSARTSVNAAAITSVNNVVSAQGVRLDAVSAAAVSLAYDVSILDTRVSAVSAAVSVNTLAVTSVNAVVSALTVRLDTVSARVSTNAAAITSINAYVSVIAVTVANFDIRLVNAEASISVNAAAITSINAVLSTIDASALASLEPRVSALEIRVAAVSASVSVLNGQMTQVVASISAINSVLNNIDASALASLAPRVSALEIQVSAVSASLTAFQVQVSNTFTSLNASNLTTGTVPTARLASGTANSTTFLRGDQVWAVPSGGGGGASYEVGQIVVATDMPSTGTWLETGKYYSKATYSALSSVVGSVPDIGAFAVEPQATLPIPFNTLAAPNARYVTATDGTTTVVGGTGGTLRKTTDGVTWTPVISPVATSIREVRYLNGNFIAVIDGVGGSNGVVLTYSSDGLTWAASYTGVATSSGNTPSIAFGSGRYVLINGSGTSGVAYSTDLVNWTQGSFPSIANSIRRVIFANSLFVAVGTNSCFTSPDGITWTSRTIPTGIYSDVIYANGLYVAYGNSIISTSPDGVTWTSRFTATGVNQVIYGNSLFVAVCGDGAIQTSTDGLTWTARTSGATFSLNGVCWNGTNYVAVGTFGRFLTSPDGTTWAVNLDASLSVFNQVDVVSGKTVAFGATACVVLAGATRSTPLLSGAWPYGVNVSSATNPRPVAYNGSNQYVVVGNNGWILTSTDGNSWTGRHSGILFDLNGAFYLNGNYLALGAGGAGNNLITSADGVTWTPRTAGTATYNAAAFGASAYVVVGVSGAVFSSADLATWTSQSAGANTFNDVIFANSLFVAVGAAGAIYTSADGVTWTSQSAGSTQFNRVVYDNSLFVAVGNSGVIYTSTNGITWTLRTSNVASGLTDVVWNGSLFCAVGGSGVITTSADGTTWTARTPGDTTVTLMSVAWSGTRFIVTNTNNAGVWTSTDGISWSKVYSAATNNATRRTSYLGGRFISVGASGGRIETSTDGLTWRAADQVQYVPTTISRLQKTNGFYYALTDRGVFQSSDGIAFTPIRQIVADNVSRGVAYNGSEWVQVCTQLASGLPAAVFKSTDGTTWSKSADLFTFASTSSILVSGLNDCEYANGNFVFSISSVVVNNALLHRGVYTSSDAVTWTPRLLPFGAAPAGLAIGQPMASDGTTLLIPLANPTIVARSSDGGVNWSPLTATTTGTQLVAYDSGIWSILGFITADIDVRFSSPNNANRTATGFYVHNSQFFYTFSSFSARFIHQIGGAAGIDYAVASSRVAISPANSGKLFALRGSTLVVPVGTGLSALNPFLVAECPLYSYDTGTTFWVPPQAAGGGQIAYIYAGP